jgi:hypothetical protein
MYQIGETELTALPETEPRAGAAAVAGYRAEADLFTGWSMWRHLARADALRNGVNGGTVAAGTLHTVATPAALESPATDPHAGHAHD